jgi:hypothetical protein
MKRTSRRRVDVNVDELDRIIDGAMREPLNETDGQTLKTALHAMAERLVRGRNTEKTSSVLGNQDRTAPPDETQPEASDNKPAGMGVMARTLFGAPKKGCYPKSVISVRQAAAVGRSSDRWPR